MKDYSWKNLIYTEKEITYFRKIVNGVYEVTHFSKGIKDYGLLLDYVFNMNDLDLIELKKKAMFKTDEQVIEFITGNEIFNDRGYLYNIKDFQELKDLFKLRGITINNTKEENTND